MDKVNLALGLPINIDGVGVLFQTTIKEISEMYDELTGVRGFQLYEDYLSPFFIDIRLFDDESIQSKFKTFDMFFCKKPDGEFLLQYKDDMMFKLLLKSLSFFFKCEVDFEQFDEIIYLSQHGKPIGQVNRGNFDLVSTLILEVNGMPKSVPEKPPVFQNDRQKDVYEKIQAGRKRQAEQNRINYATMINSVMYGGKCFIPVREIYEMTFWQLSNAYKTILTLDNWKINYPLLCVQIDPKGMDLSHWSNSIKI